MYGAKIGFTFYSGLVSTSTSAKARILDIQFSIFVMAGRIRSGLQVAVERRAIKRDARRFYNPVTRAFWLHNVSQVPCNQPR